MQATLETPAPNPVSATIFSSGDLGCEIGDKGIYCYYNWLNPGASPTKAEIFANRTLNLNKIYPYSGGHPKHPIKFSSDSTHDIYDLDKWSTNWE